MTRSISLAGEWRLALDDYDAGLRERWHTRELVGSVQLPGSLMEQRIGHAVTALETPWMGQIQYDHEYFVSPEFEKYRRPDNLKIPYWLTPPKYFAGPAWYQREVDVPAEWAGRRVVLFLERPHWQTRVFIDDHEAPGAGGSLAGAHEFDLTDFLTPGRHRLTVRVDNRMIVNVGANAHSVSDHTQGNWNGVVGAIELRAGPTTWIDHVAVQTTWADRGVRVRGTIGNRSGASGAGFVRLSVDGGATRGVPVEWDAAGGAFDATLTLPEDAALWDEFSPALHDLRVDLVESGQTVPIDSRSLRFGIREWGSVGRQLTINGRPTMLRGTLECCIFPLTGYPPTEVEPWARIMRVVKSHGLNHIRFHSYCPPEAAFVAADEAGVYLQVECSTWPNQGATVGDGGPIDRWLYAEGHHIVQTFGHHPSFCIMASGNEPAGPRHESFLSEWVTYWKQHDPARLHTTSAGWPIRPESDVHSAQPPRIHQWGDGLRSRINALPPETTTDYRAFVEKYDQPVISHEIGQWCAFPNLDEIAKYKGVMQARNFEIVRERMAERGMLELAKPMLIASGKLQTLCYKEEIESALRTPGFGGFQLLDLHDFPGQGTALVGVLDAFWEGKGYVSAEEFRRFCNSTVPLARLARRTFECGNAIEASIEVAHFGPDPLREAMLTWTLHDDRGHAVRVGRIGPTTLRIGNGATIGTVRIDTSDLTAPARYRLVVGIDGTAFENDWDVWVYSRGASADEPSVRVVTSPDGLAEAVRTSSAVLYLPPPASVKTSAVLGFSSIFWNTCWTQGQPPHTLGVLCDPSHASLASFPTGSHTDWQWWDVVHGGAAMDLTPLGSEAGDGVVVRVIDDWNALRPLALVIEGRIGNARVLMCSADLSTNLDKRPAARQFRASLVRYAASPKFAPKAAWTIEQMRGMTTS
jgi:hypothetical protein